MLYLFLFTQTSGDLPCHKTVRSDQLKISMSSHFKKRADKESDLYCSPHYCQLSIAYATAIIPEHRLALIVAHKQKSAPIITARKHQSDSPR